MAKLSARNRTCQVEVSREYTQEQIEKAQGSDSLTVWSRVTRRLMSDGKVLEKRDVRFRPTPNCTWEDPNGRRHSYGWKVHGTLKSGLTADDYARIYRQNRKDGTPSPWTVNTSGRVVKAVIISLARVQRAVASDSNTGFCIECGSDQDGVEPDAEGYQCHSCGQFAVKGAENLLMELV